MLPGAEDRYRPLRKLTVDRQGNPPAERPEGEITVHSRRDRKVPQLNGKNERPGYRTHPGAEGRGRHRYPRS